MFFFSLVNHVFVETLTWYFIGVYIIKKFILLEFKFFFWFINGLFLGNFKSRKALSLQTESES